MKKIVLLLSISLSLISCQLKGTLLEEEDVTKEETIKDVPVKEDPIKEEILLINENFFGKWNIIKSNGQTVNDCKKKDLYHFRSDGAINVKFHHGTGVDCKLAHEIPFKAGLTWDLREGKLFLVYGGPEEPMAHVIKFEDKNTVKFTVWKEDGSIKYTETLSKQQN